MKIKLFFYTLLLSFSSPGAYSQSKDLPIFTRFTIINEDGTKHVFHADNLKYRAVSEKTYTWYSTNMLHTTMGGYSGKLLYGQFTTFFPNKSLSERGNYAFGMKDGIWKSWYENGNLKKESQWLAGIEEGPFIEYNEQGKWRKRGHFKDNRLHGIIEEIQNDSINLSYYAYGNAITKDEYLDSNIFRKSGKLIGNKINQWFRKKDKQETTPTASE